MPTLEPDNGCKNSTPTIVDSQCSTIDTSRPFRSVKEAVAIFGERFLVGEIYSPKKLNFPNKENPYYSPSPRKDKDPQWDYTSHSPMNSSYRRETTPSLLETVKKLEAELEHTKKELKLLKERESKNEVALASLKVELHENMSKLAEAKMVIAGRGVDDGAMIANEEGKKMDAFVRKENGTYSRKLAQILSIREEESLFGMKRKEKKMKKKPIVPLVGDLLNRTKGTSTSSLYNPLQWNF